MSMPRNTPMTSIGACRDACQIQKNPTISKTAPIKRRIAKDILAQRGNFNEKTGFNFPFF